MPHENQQPQGMPSANGAAATHPLVHWTETIRQTDGLALLPVKGKRPWLGSSADTADWQKQTAIKPAGDVIATPGATGVGVFTGYKPGATHHLICFDFDGPSARPMALQILRELGHEPVMPGTWTVHRTDLAGTIVPGYEKLLFSITPAQWAWFQQAGGGPDSTGLQRTLHTGVVHEIPLPPAADGTPRVKTKREGLEVFCSTARQVVILGEHPSRETETSDNPQADGHYGWPVNGGFAHLQELPQAWFQLAQAVMERRAAVDGDSLGQLRMPGRRGRSATTSSRDWINLGDTPRNACPVCGRDSNGGCRIHRDGKTLLCFGGNTFSWENAVTHQQAQRVKQARLAGRKLKPNQVVVQGHGGPWVLTDLLELDWAPNGYWAVFVQQQPGTATTTTPTTPQPWMTEPIAPAPQVWDQPAAPHILPPGHGRAAESVITVVPVAHDRPGAEQLLHRMADLQQRCADLGFDHPELNPAMDAQWQALLDAIAQFAFDRADGKGTPASIVAGHLGALKAAALEHQLVGTGNPDPWAALLKPRVLRLQQQAADSAMAERHARAQQGLMEARRQFTAEQIAAAGCWRTRELFVHESLEQGPGGSSYMSPAELRAHGGLCDQLAGFLQYNTLMDRVELVNRNVLVPDPVHGQPAPLVAPIPEDQVGNADLLLGLAGYNLHKTQATDLVVTAAKRNSYNPVTDYLRAVADNPDLAGFDLLQVAPMLLGTTDPLDAELMRRTLIAAVARAMEPGCKVDTMLVIKGPQDSNKSRFWEALVPNQAEWLTQTEPSKPEDLLIAQHTCWFYGTPELDGTTSKKHVAQMKAMVSTRTDTVRKPYAKAAGRYHRPSVMVACVNPDQFLHDETGSRRFWVIEVQQGGIDVDATLQVRDHVWHAAVHAYRAGQKWWLEPEQQQLLLQRNAAYEADNGTAGPVAAWLHSLRGKPAGTCFDAHTALVNSGCAPHRDRVKPSQLSAIGPLLRSAGWVRTENAVHCTGLRLRVWYRQGEQYDLTQKIPDQPPEPGASGATGRPDPWVAPWRPN